MKPSGMGFLHHTGGSMRLRADFGRGNLCSEELPAAPQPDVDVRDDVTRLATLGPALVLAVAAALALFPQTAHSDALTPRGREDADDIIVAAARPDDAVGT